jgi:DNA-binding GntR family transcriptional regulator
MDDVANRPFYELLPVELRGATQTIGADVAEPGDSALLAIPVGAPVLRCRRVTNDVDGQMAALRDLGALPPDTDLRAVIADLGG